MNMVLNKSVPFLRTMSAWTSIKHGLSPMPRLSPILTVTSIVAALTSFLALSGLAHAGEYQWIEHPTDTHGKPDIIPTHEKATLCRGLQESINSLGPLRDPLLCERPLNPKFKDFTKPEWTSLDPRQHIELIKKMDIALNYNRYKAPPFDAEAEAQWRAGLPKRLEKIALAIVKVDLNGDGYTEMVVKYNRSGVCDEVSAKHPGITGVGVRYFVSDDGFSEVMALSSFTKDGEIFIHQGTAYFSQVDYDPPSDEYMLVVQEPAEYHSDPNNLCQLRFTPDKCPAETRPHFGYATVCRFKYHDYAATGKTGKGK